MDTEEKIEELGQGVEGSANLMRGMLFDPAIPESAKDAMRAKIAELEELIERHF